MPLSLSWIGLTWWLLFRTRDLFQFLDIETLLDTHHVDSYGLQLISRTRPDGVFREV